MTDGDRLLAAVHADPADAAVRLVYADWLEEHAATDADRDRAAFIRAESELADLEADPHDDPARADLLARRADELRARHARAWFGKAFGDAVTTRRGFADGVALSNQQFLTRGAELFAAHPTLRAVTLGRLGNSMPAVAACPTLALVESLTFADTAFRSRQTDELAASPHLGRLREFRLRSTTGSPSLWALGRAKSLRQLEVLDVHNRGIYDSGAESLFRSQRLATLRDVTLRVAGLTDAAARELAAASHLELRALDLAGNRLYAAGFAALAAAPHLAGLKRLDLSGHWVEAGRWPLASATFAGSLRVLKLRDCHAPDADLAGFLAAPWPRLTELDLAGNGFGPLAAAAVAGNPSLRGLRSLSVGGGRFDVDAARSLGAADLPILKHLSISDSSLTADGVRHLLAGPLAANLCRLDLPRCAVTDDGVEALAGNPALARVWSLGLAQNGVTGHGALVLAASPHLAALARLDLADNAIHPAGRAALAERFAHVGL